MQIVIALFILSMIGALVQRTSGFGFGIFMMTMLPAIMPTYGEATALSGLLSISMSIFVAWRMRSYITWRHMRWMLGAFLITSTFAILALQYIDDRTLRIVLGIVLIFLSFYFTIFSQYIKIKPTTNAQLVSGSLSGVMGGFFGMHGAPAALYFVVAETSKEAYMAMSQMYYTIGNFTMSLVRLYNHYFTSTVMIDYLYGIGGVIIGTQIGRWVFRYIKQSTLRFIVYIYIGISGLLILLSALHKGA